MRTLGYLFGFLLLLDGIPATLSPHFWVKYTERNLKDTLPEPVTRTVLEFGHLPEGATRVKALAEVLIGMTLLFLASASAGATAFYGKVSSGHAAAPHIHPHMHAHPHQHGEMRHSHPHRHDEPVEGARQQGEEAI
jgi:uncharacterized protein YjeT (DUF2065 family)